MARALSAAYYRRRTCGPAGVGVASIAGIDLGGARELATLVVESRRATAGETSALTDVLDYLA